VGGGGGLSRVLKIIIKKQVKFIKMRERTAWDRRKMGEKTRGKTNAGFNIRNSSEKQKNKVGLAVHGHPCPRVLRSGNTPNQHASWGPSADSTSLLDPWAVKKQERGGGEKLRKKKKSPKAERKGKYQAARKKRGFHSLAQVGENKGA